MSLLESVFGGDPKQYVQSGYELTQTLVARFSLPGWANGRPALSDTERRYLDEMLGAFKEGSAADAKSQGGETLSYHPEYWGYIERALTDCALRIESIENYAPHRWESALSTNLKAWASGLNPWVMLDIAEILHTNREPRFAKQALKTCSVFPKYWNTRTAKEREFGLLSYVTIRVYVPRYAVHNLMDVGEPRSIEKLIEEASSMEVKLS